MQYLRDKNVNTPKILSINYGSYNAIRMLIGVYHAAFLISTGISISQLAILQIIFSITILILDFPLAVVADRFYRKQMVVIGVFFTILFYPLCILSPNFIALIFSEIFYAIGICCISGAIEGWVLSSLQSKRADFSIYAHLCQRISSVGSVFTGIIGVSTAFVFGTYKTGYIISIIMMIIVFMIFILIPNGKGYTSKGDGRNGIIHHSRESIGLILKNIDGRYYLTISCIFTFGVQIIYHFWQPIMLSGDNIGRLSTNELIILMFCHIGAFSFQYLTNFLLPRFDVKGRMYSILVMMFSLFSSLLCIFLIFLLTSKITIMSVFIYSCLHGMMSTIPIGAQNIFVSNINNKDDDYISGSFGLVSFACRVSSIAVLGSISILSDRFPVYYYMLIPALAYLVCGFIFLKWPLRKEMK